MRILTTWWLAVLFLLPTASVLGMASTTRIAEPGTVIGVEWVKTYGWPEGTLALVNGPARQNAWQPWFSEHPNDVIHFEMVPGDMQQLNALIQRLAEIQSPVRRIVLSPGTEPSALGFVTSLEPGNSIPAVFAIGSQPMLDRWWERLPADKQFGVHHYEAPPRAVPPTLTIYLEHEMVELDALKVPLDFEIGVVKVRPEQAEEFSAVLKEIEEFVSEHQQLREERLPPASLQKRP